MNLFELGEQPYSESDAEWDAFVTQHPHGSLLQTDAWARLKSRFGWAPKRTWVKKDGEIVAGAQMLIRGAAMGLVKVGYIPHGPLVDWRDPEQLEVTLNQVDLTAYQMRAGLVLMEPLLWEAEFGRQDWLALSQKHDLIPDAITIQPPRTVRIDLTPSEEEIMARMHKKTRYNIRLSAKKEVTVRQGSLSDVAIFNKLIRTTGARNEFGVHAPQYYETAFEQFDTHQPGSVALFIAEYQEQPLAAIMVFVLGKQAAYLYGASSDVERQRMPTYAVQWAAIRYAKAQGCTHYDMWGIPDYPEEQLEAEYLKRQDGLWGVYRFKRGFGGSVDRTVGAADRVYNRLTYKLYNWRRGT